MFPRAYDLLMADVDYEAIYKWLEPYLGKEKTILDAGCGSGYLLLELVKHKHHAIGIDIDSVMLSLADDKLREANLTANLFEHDLRNSLGVKFDVILAMFDVVNYFKGLKTVFQHIYDGLNEHGVFIFDLYKEDVLNDYHDYTETDNEPIDYEWHMRSNKQLLIHDVRIGDESFEIRQYVYALSYYVDLLCNLGFKVEVKEGIDSRKHYIVAFK